MLVGLSVLIIAIATTIILVAGMSPPHDASSQTDAADSRMAGQAARDLRGSTTEVQALSNETSQKSHAVDTPCTDSFSFMKDLERLPAFRSLDDLAGKLERLNVDELHFFTGRHWQAVVIVGDSDACLEGVTIVCEFKNMLSFEKKGVRELIIQISELLSNNSKTESDFTDMCKVGEDCILDKLGVRIRASVRSAELWSAEISQY